MKNDTKLREGECKVCEYEFQEYWDRAEYFDYGSQIPADQCRACYSERVDERIDRR